jgi:hypothetical protein
MIDRAKLFEDLRKTHSAEDAFNKAKEIQAWIGAPSQQALPLNVPTPTPRPTPMPEPEPAPRPRLSPGSRATRSTTISTGWSLKASGRRLCSMAA